MTIDIRYHYVEGHQEERYGIPTDKWGTLNQQMDEMAKLFRETNNNNINKEDLSPAEWNVELPTGKVVNKFKTTISRYIRAKMLEEKWVNPPKKRGLRPPPILTKQQIQAIDFPTTQKAWNTLRPGRKRFVQRLLVVGRLNM